jgi:hypothetical protein
MRQGRHALPAMREWGIKLEAKPRYVVSAKPLQGGAVALHYRRAKGLDQTFQ